MPIGHKLRSGSHPHSSEASARCSSCWCPFSTGFPPAPNCHIEWTRAHPERREKDNVKWTYRDWGIFLADAAASNNHAPFNEIYGIHQMTNRFLSLDLRDIIFDLLAPDHCYWEWKESSRLPVIGDLNEFRLHLHSLRPTISSPQRR